MPQRSCPIDFQVLLADLLVILHLAGMRASSSWNNHRGLPCGLPASPSRPDGFPPPPRTPLCKARPSVMQIGWWLRAPSRPPRAGPQGLPHFLKAGEKRDARLAPGVHSSAQRTQAASLPHSPVQLGSLLRAQLAEPPHPALISPPAPTPCSWNAQGLGQPPSLGTSGCPRSPSCPTHPALSCQPQPCSSSLHIRDGSRFGAG